MMRQRILAALVLAAALGPAQPAGAVKTERLAAAGPRSAAAGVGALVGSGEVLVRYSTAAAAGERAAPLAGLGARVVRELPSVGWTLVGLPPGMSVGEGLERVGGLPGVLEVQPNHAYTPDRIANDPYFWTQYHLDITNTPAAWDTETGSTNKVTIAVLDTGIDGSHPDLAGKLVAGSRDCTVAGCALANDPPTAACNHATRVSGVAAAASNNGNAVTGVSWGAQLLSMKLFSAADCTTSCGDKAGGAGCSTLDTMIVDALDYVRTNIAAVPGTYGKVVVNMSIGDDTVNCAGGSAMDTAIANSWTAGIVNVVAAGNANKDVAMPADCSGAASLIPVAATDRHDARASFSNFGAELANNGVAAPGVDIVTTDLGGGVTGAATGTSFSTPFVSGVAALIRAAVPGATPAQIRTAIRAGALDLGTAGNDNFYGAGRVNACKALKSALAQPDTCGSASGLPGYAADTSLVPFPNPLRLSQRSTMTIKLPQDMQDESVSLKIFTMDGSLVRSLNSTAGADAIVWDAKNDAGREVATGVYILAGKSSKGTRRGRAAVIR